MPSIAIGPLVHAPNRLGRSKARIRPDGLAATCDHPKQWVDCPRNFSRCRTVRKKQQQTEKVGRLYRDHKKMVAKLMVHSKIFGSKQQELGGRLVHVQTETRIGFSLYAQCDELPRSTLYNIVSSVATRLHALLYL